MGIINKIGSLKIAQGAFSWASYWRSLSSAVVENAQPTKLILTFTKANTNLSYSDLSVTGHAIESLSRDVTNKILTLTLSTPLIVFEDALYVTLNKGISLTYLITNNVSDDTNTVAWYDSQALTTISKDSSNRVASWADKLASGRDLLQSGADNLKPVWSAESITLDGIRQFMQTAVETWDRPEYIYAVFEVDGTQTSTFLFDGRSADGSGVLYPDNTGGVENLGMGAGFWPASFTSKFNKYIIAGVLFNATGSKYWSGGGARLLSTGTLNMSGFTIGKPASSNSNYAKVKFKEIIRRKVDDSAGVSQDLIYQYLQTKYASKTWKKYGTVLSVTNPAKVWISEPTVIHEGNPMIFTEEISVFKMWYDEVLDTNFDVCYAESRDGISWTKYTGNPILTNHQRTSVTKSGNTYYLTATDPTDSQIDLYSSADGITFALVKVNILAKGAAGEWDDTNLANTYLFIENGTWYLFYEALHNNWAIGLATSVDNGDTWTKEATNPIIGSKTAYGMTRGGPFLIKSGANYYIWCHGWDEGLTPNEILRYKSSNLIAWTKDVLMPTFRRTSIDEGVLTSVGQVADQCLLEYNGKVYLWYMAAVNASLGPASIKLAISDMPLADLVLTDEGVIL